MTDFLRAIPTAAQSPYAIAAYGIAAILMLFGGFKLYQLKIAVGAIKKTGKNSPPLREIIEIATNTKLPDRITGEQWIRNNCLQAFTMIIIALIIAAIVVAVMAIELSGKATIPTNHGVLKPRESNPVGTTSSLDFISRFNTGSGIMEFNITNGQTILPFGKTIPLWITKTPDGLLISGEFRSLDGKVIGELFKNEWRVNPNNLKRNFDRWALEIIDDYNIPRLQVEYLTPTSIRLGGVFCTQDEGSSKMVADFQDSITPSDGHGTSVNSFGPGVFIVLGNGSLKFRRASNLDSDSTKQAFANEVRKMIRPWFDYTPSRGIGVRLPPESRVM